MSDKNLRGSTGTTYENAASCPPNNVRQDAAIARCLYYACGIIGTVAENVITSSVYSQEPLADPGGKVRQFP